MGFVQCYTKNDVKCAGAWAHNTSGAIVTSSDQGDQAVQEPFIHKCGTDFYIIVDHFGQMVIRQMKYVQHFWRAGNSGGMYFCVDFQTSLHPEFEGDDRGLSDIVTDHIQTTIDNITFTEWPRQAIFEDIEDMDIINCYKEICSFFKRRWEVWVTRDRLYRLVSYLSVVDSMVLGLSR